MRAAAAKAIRDLIDTTCRHFDSACETFAEWLWILESETGDTANEFGDESIADSEEASRLGDDAAMHGFAIVGAWLKSFPSTWDAIGVERSELSRRYADFLCRIFAEHELTMTSG